MRRDVLVCLVMVVIACQLHCGRANFNFVLPGKWGNSKRSFSFVLPGQWGNSKRAEELSKLGECGRVDPEALYAIYHIIQSEALRIMDCSQKEATEKQ